MPSGDPTPELRDLGAVPRGGSRPTPQELLDLGLLSLEPVESEGVYVFYAWPGFVKIGRSGDIRRRIASTQVECPLDVHLLAVLSTDRSQESCFHLRLSKQHQRGEWFRLDGPTILVITDSYSNYSVPRTTWPNNTTSGPGAVLKRAALVEYILNRRQEGRTFASISRELGTSPTRVRQITVRHKKGLS